MVKYNYDTWGKLISIEGSLKDTVGIKNPYRYRGYRYDTDTGLYYLQSRYYNPEWGRFINVDDYDTLTASINDLTDKNLFAYCDNNPVMRTDEGGYFWANILIGATVGAAISIGAQLMSGRSVSDINWREVGGAALSGAIASIPGLGLVGTALVGGIGNVAGGYVGGSIKSSRDVAIGFISGSVANGTAYKVAKVTGNIAKKSFEKLPRYVRKAKLSNIYTNKGNMRNTNLRTARLDSNFGEKLAPIRSFVYSTISSEILGRSTDYGLRRAY